MPNIQIYNKGNVVYQPSVPVTDEERPYLPDNYAWDDFVVPELSSRVGGTAPNFIEYRDGIFADQFAVGEEVHTSMQMPHRWQPGSSILLHVHLALPVAADGTDNVKFQCIYEKADLNTVGTVDTIVKEIAVTGGSQYEEFYLEFPAISMTGLQESAILLMKISRIDASGDEYGNDIVVKSIDAHYRAEKLGTAQDTPPFTP